MNSMPFTISRFISAPLYADISVTDRCNLSCAYCYANATIQNSNNMEVTLFEKISSELEACGVHYLRIAGGEPLMHPKISDILNIAGRRKLLTSMSTNATLIDSNTANIIHRSGINWVVVSLDGADKKTNDLTRGSFDYVVNGIKHLINAGVHTKLATVVSSTNYMYHKEIIKFAESLHVASVGFLLFSSVGRAVNNLSKLQMNASQLKEFILSINEYKAKNKNSININIVFPHESFIPWQLSAFLNNKDISQNWLSGHIEDFERFVGCMAGISTCAITSDGRLFGCEQMFEFDELCAGSLVANSFQELWINSPIFDKLRKLQITDLDKRCIHCIHKNCGGGCRAVAFSQTGRINGFDSSCMIINDDGG